MKVRTIAFWWQGLPKGWREDEKEYRLLIPEHEGAQGSVLKTPEGRIHVELDSDGRKSELSAGLSEVKPSQDPSHPNDLHVVVQWSPKTGAQLFLNGELFDTTRPQ